jgi:hypothetical protein
MSYAAFLQLSGLKSCPESLAIWLHFCLVGVPVRKK